MLTIMAGAAERYATEFAGTAFLVYIVLATGNALAIGSALAIAIMLGGALSGGAFNPAVTLAMYLRGALSGKDSVMYGLAQLAGGIAALKLSQHMRI